MKRFLKINAIDNVAVALADDLKAGEVVDVDGAEITLKEDIGRGHKFAIRAIAEGENVVKYGYPIGHATTAIEVGEWVHSHNLKTNLNDNIEYSYDHKIYTIACPKHEELRVMGTAICKMSFKMLPAESGRSVLRGRRRLVSR